MTGRALLWDLARPYRRRLAAGIALMLGQSLAALGFPWVAGMLAGALLAGPHADVAPVLGVLIAIFGVQAACKAGSGYLLDAAADGIVSDLRVRLFEQLQALPLAYHATRRSGDSLSLLAGDAHVIGGFIGGTAMAAAPLVLTAGGAAFLMLAIHPGLAMIAVVLVPVFYLAVKLVGRRLRPLAGQTQDAEAEVIGLAQENLDMLPAIKAFAREERESERFRAQVEHLAGLTARRRRVIAAFGPSMEFLAGVGVLLLLVMASATWRAGVEPVAAVAFILYALLLSRPMAELADVYGRTQSMRGALARVVRALAQMREPQGGSVLGAGPGEIAIGGLRFAYEGRDASVDGLDLHVRPRETIVILGPNGAGKSTLAALLLRLYSPQSGSIRIDGVDIATVSLASLRGRIGYVPQHALLFHGSIRENIAFGQQGAGWAAIEAAARAAGAHDFIESLPEGYETVIGERGARLSGGQRQKLALARALLKDPPILLLDEATSMFDPLAEREFFEACAESLRRRTVILITHRAADLVHADRIVHMNAGQIVLIEPARARCSSSASSR